ncbi:head-tail connector protein [Emcibacter sp.]|uniref:head-tail connector protein n=1 Tax=Emcibacter sp. TaxID=1979954 RepID=UPI002AA6E1E4|nr:head-tail connector protein [Emcibacter sp.]
MKLDLITPPVAEPVTLAEVKEFLKIDHADEDSLLLGLIRSGRQACETFIDRKLVHQVWRCFRNDWGMGPVYLPFSPILSVEEVAVFKDGDYSPLSADSYLLDTGSFRPRLVQMDGQGWPLPEIPVAGIRTTFTAGYGDSWNEVPADLRQGLLHWIAGCFTAGEDTLREKRLAEGLWRPYRMVKL